LWFPPVVGVPVASVAAWYDGGEAAYEVWDEPKG